MITRTEPEPDRPDPGLSVIINERQLLINLGYRLLGSLTEAEDAVQEAFTRWSALPREQQLAIESPGGWLTRVTSRICLDLLGSARVRRESYVGDWLPEPLPDRSVDGALDPVDRILLDESVTLAFLVLLETMTPAERVVFILHDVFRYTFVEVAGIVGRTPAACRKLASSGRRRVGAAPGLRSAPDRHTAVVREFKRAWEAKDIGALIAVLDSGATATADGGGLATAGPPIEGGEQVGHYLIELLGRTSGLSLTERTVNGRPGLVAEVAGRIVTVYAFGVAGDRITRLWAIRNPDKLRPWTGDGLTLRRGDSSKR